MGKARTGKHRFVPRHKCEEARSVLASFHTQKRSWWHRGLPRFTENTEHCNIYKRIWNSLRKTNTIFLHNWSLLPKPVTVGEGMTEKPVLSNLSYFYPEGISSQNNFLVREVRFFVCSESFHYRNIHLGWLQDHIQPRSNQISILTEFWQI